MTNKPSSYISFDVQSLDNAVDTARWSTLPNSRAVLAIMERIDEMILRYWCAVLICERNILGGGGAYLGRGTTAPIRVQAVFPIL